LLVVGQGAGLERDERLAFFGFHDPDVFRVDDLLFGNAIFVRIPRLVLEQDLLSLTEDVEVVEDQMRSRALVPETMAGNVGVRALLPGKTRSRYVDDGFLELLILDRVVDGYVRKPQNRNC
jgi:hypothetical protein